jgi:hypothetical protein
MLSLNSSAFVAVTGNALTVAEDLARRFIYAALDAQMEDPENRPFRPGFLASIQHRRAELLVDLLTIWRFGRQNPRMLRRGKPFGSFETWCDWVRDPLLTLGCTDPVERISEVKSKDPRRRQIEAILTTWWDRHGGAPLKASSLHSDVVALIDPQGRGRQFLAAAVEKIVGTRVGGLTLTVERGDGKWAVSTYAVHHTTASAEHHAEHRGHGGHRADDDAETDPIADGVAPNARLVL